MRSNRVLLVHQNVQPPGGANAVAAWTLQALKDCTDLTLLTWEPADTQAINRFYGTSLSESDFRVLRPSRFVQLLRKLDPDPGSLQIPAYLMRVCRRIRRNYDLVIGTQTEEMDLGESSLLYVHHPDLARFWGRYEDCGGKTLRTKLRNLLTGRTRPWIVLSDFSLHRLKSAHFVANSNWTAERIREAYGSEAAVLYPPVSATPGLPWEQRENAFLASGRFNRRKRLDWIVQVLARVRLEAPGIRLHLVGTREDRDDGPAYFRQLQTLVAANAAWVTMHENLSREQLTELTGTVRYGFHAQIDEHFGIAPAEALMAGCIPFVHDSGGQVEIAGCDPRLCFTTEADAVAKLHAVLADARLQQSLLSSLESRRQLFTPEKFMQGIREATGRLLQEPRSLPAESRA